MFKSLRYRLLASFFVFIVLAILAIIPFNIIYRNKENKIFTFTNIVNSLQIDLNKELRYSANFISYEAGNPEFYITGESKLLNKHYIYVDSINKKIDLLAGNNIANTIDISSDLDLIKDAFKNYISAFDSIIIFTYKRGYNNYGLQGEVAYYMQEFRDHSLADPILLLDIQQNEKDYINWKDTAYANRVFNLADKLSADIINSAGIDNSNKREMLGLLNNYKNSFRHLVRLDKQIGRSDNEGLKGRILRKVEEIENQLTVLLDKSNQYNYAYNRKLNTYYTLFIVLLIAFSLIASFLISKHILHHLENLNQYISKLTKHKFRYHETLDVRNATREIAHIYKSFRNLVALLNKWEDQRNSALHNAEKNEKRYRDLADLLPQSIFETDELGNFTYVNRNWYNTFGYSPRDLQEGLNLIETIISETGNGILGHTRFENSQFTAIRKDGTQFPASVYSDNIMDYGKVIGRRGIIIDVTERNQYIAALQKEKSKAQTSDQYKSSFLANMSHEIRTPMNSIIGFTNLLSNEAIPDNQKKEFVTYIKSSGEMLLNLIDDIIDIAKIEAGEIRVNKTECDINKLFPDLLKAFKGYKNKNNKQHLRLNLLIPDATTPLPVKTDCFRLKQIITNLLSNAVKFTDNGDIDFGYNIKNDSFIEFFVKDTGVGLSPEEIKVIFERFKRTRQSEDKKISGTGLGLSITKNLVELLGGEMWVESEPGKGSLFSFSLPYIRITEPLKSAEPEEKMPGNYAWKDKIFLIVEDDIQSFSYLKEILRPTSASILWSQEGDEAIKQCLKNSEIDLVLMDIQLPKKNGYEATKEIRKNRPSLPIIAQTAYAMEGDREKSVLAGCDDYITKPLNAVKLLAKIAQFVETPGTYGQIKRTDEKNKLQESSVNEYSSAKKN